ncbi:hypothetical protein Ancab_030463 [Ancistrocladus abbreviatus]
MRPGAIDLNVATIDQYPVIKVLSRSDLTTSQLVLPRRASEEHIIPYMDAQLRERLTREGRRTHIRVVDDALNQEYYLTMVDRDHRYSVISWSHVLQNRDLREGQTLRFGWFNEKLHFIVDNQQEEDVKIEEGKKADDKDRKSEGDQEVEDIGKGIIEPPKKKMKEDMAGTSSPQQQTEAVVDP